MLNRLSRTVWYGVLWLSRRPWAKRLQRASIQLAPERLRPRMRASMARQNAWARRYGLRVVRLSLTMVLLSAAFWGVWLLLILAADQGWLVRPASPDEVQGLEDRFR